ncbi:MAG: hypothetical protein HY928_04075 [Elusimicrobia bacterium]|nr:hypothetical protein [Elusimicrobiota bacterium]
MAQRNDGLEPAFAYSVGFTITPAVLLGVALYIQDSWTPNPALAKSLLWLAGAYGLLSVGINGAMAEPLPIKPTGEGVPLRLRISWGLLGLCPRPGRKARLGAAIVVAALFAHPLPSLSFPGLLAAASVLVPALLMEKPASMSEMEGFEAWFIAGAVAVGVGALFMVADPAPGTAWQGLAVLGALAALTGQRAREVTALRWAELLPGVPPPPALDLSRYELSVARKAPEKRAALPAGVDAQLVDTGSFRVDAAKMLDKLRSYQLSDPQDFILAWLRCAAASGAEVIELTRSWNAVELRFDGRPFSAAELSQPYQVLVDGEGADARRGRHFAYGLLALYRLAPTRVCVTSRGPDGVAVMKAGSGAAADPETAPAGTVLRVEWPAWAVLWRPFLVGLRAKTKFGLGPARLAVDGTPVPDMPTGSSWEAFGTKTWRGAYRTRLAGGRVRLYVLGTLIEEFAPQGIRADAWLTHDRLELNISQSAVLRDGLVENGLQMLASRVRRSFDGL